jgi:hypothetical protein
MACFDDIIGIEQVCDEITPTSGFYLNQIGINKKEIEDMVTSDYASVEDFVAKKSAFAIQLCKTDIYSKVSPMFKTGSILAGNRVGYESSQKELIAQTGYVGVEVTVYNPQSFIDFTVANFSLFTNYTGTIPVLVYDVHQGKLLGTIPVVTVAGQISTSYLTISVPAPRKEILLWIGYDSDAFGGISSYKTITHNGCTDCRGFTFNHRFVRATGASIVSPFTDTNLTSLTHTGGLSFNYSVTCNHEDWLCSHRRILGMPFLYRTGMEVCKHALYAAPNQRTMAITTVNIELMEKKLKEFETEYDRIMTNIMNSMRPPSDRACFECNDRIKSRTILP